MKGEAGFTQLKYRGGLIVNTGIGMKAIVLILRKKQVKKGKLQFDMRYKVNRDYFKKINLKYEKNR